MAELNKESKLSIEATNLISQFDSLTDGTFGGFMATKTAFDKNFDSALADIKSQEITIVNTES